MHRVYVGRLSHIAQDRDVERIFKSYGKVKEILIKNGYAFVEFDSYRDADDAVRGLNGKVAFGERIQVEHARGTPRGEDLLRDMDRGYKPPRFHAADNRYGSRRDSRIGPRYRLIVKNLSSRVSWQDLKDNMRKVGDVIYADAHKDKMNEGVVDFSSRGDMDRALDQFDGYELFGRKLKVCPEKTRGQSPGSRSRSGSRRKSSRRRRSSGSRSHSSSYDRKRRVRDESESVSPKRKRRSGDDGKKARSRSAERSRSPEKKLKQTKAKSTKSGEKESKSRKAEASDEKKSERVQQGKPVNASTRDEGKRKHSESSLGDAQDSDDGGRVNAKEKNVGKSSDNGQHREDDGSSSE